MNGHRETKPSVQKLTYDGLESEQETNTHGNTGAVGDLITKMEQPIETIQSLPNALEETDQDSNTLGNNGNATKEQAKHNTCTGKQYSGTYALAEVLFMHGVAKKKEEVGRSCCGMTYVHPTKYKNHMKRHIGNTSMTFKCYFCETVLPNYQAFRLHQRSHLNIPFEQTNARKCPNEIAETTMPSSNETISSTEMKKVGPTVKNRLTEVVYSSMYNKPSIDGMQSQQQGIGNSEGTLPETNVNKTINQTETTSLYDETFHKMEPTSSQERPPCANMIMASVQALNPYEEAILVTSNTELKREVDPLSMDVTGSLDLANEFNVDLRSRVATEERVTCRVCNVQFINSSKLKIHLETNPSHNF